MKTIRIGSGAGYAGDRIEPAVELMEKGNLDYIIFECLAERTIAIGQQNKIKDPTKGYNNLLAERMERVLPLVVKNNIKIVTNMGAANPEQAVKVTAEIAKRLGLSGIKIAGVYGDDISDKIADFYDKDILELHKPLGDIEDTIISANVYCGAEGMIEALKGGANVVITGRVADPSLTIAPLVYEFGWNIEDNKEEMGQGILAGHLLECGGQVTGGYYADPGYKDVPDLHKLGFPIAEISENGELYITKVEGSGGIVTPDTCKEQLLYEIHDPSKYFTPDAIADFSKVEFEQVGKDRVKASCATSHGRPETLKVSIGYRDCFVGEGEISYGGENALNRAKLAAEIVEKRLELTGVELEEVRYDYIGFNSLYKDAISKAFSPEIFPEIRLRVAGRAKDQKNASAVGKEVEALYTNGPAAGGGASQKTYEVVSICSIFVPRDTPQISVEYKEV